MNYSKGISWFDDCRIPFVDESDNNTTRERYDTIGYGSKMNNGWGSMDDSAKQGRYPANLLCSDDMLNDGNIIQYNKNRKDNGTYLGGHREVYVGEGEIKKKVKGDFYNDKGSNSRYYDIDKWFDKMIDEL